MTRAQIRAVVHETVHQVGVDISSLDDNHHLQRDLGIDSVQFVHLVLELEKRFDLQVPDMDILRLKSVGNCIEYLAERLNC